MIDFVLKIKKKFVKMSKKETYSGVKKFSKVKDRREPLANFAEMKTLPHVAQTLFFLKKCRYICVCIDDDG